LRNPNLYYGIKATLGMVMFGEKWDCKKSPMLNMSRGAFGQAGIDIREASHQYENDNDNEHVITLWVRASKS
jgi:hypothetical protein